MTSEESQVHAQALLDDWTNTGAPMQNCIAFRDFVADRIRKLIEAAGSLKQESFK
jgi:hypothetical protein